MNTNEINKKYVRWEKFLSSPSLAKKTCACNLSVQPRQTAGAYYMSIHFCPLWFLDLFTMTTLERTFRLLDALGLFIVTRFPFIELFLLLMSTGERAEKAPGLKITSFKDTLRQEYILVYLNAAIFFVCGTGMTLDIKRRKCGFAALLHAIVYTAVTLYQTERYSEFLIVSAWRTMVVTFCYNWCVT